MKKGEKKLIGGYILSAIDMEENFSKGVYLDYTVRKNWPADIDTETFNKIQLLLKKLIADTARHKKIFSKLKNKLAQL